MSELLGEDTPYAGIPAAVEVVIHNAGIELRHIPSDVEGASLTLVRFHTPGTVYTIKLDEGGLAGLTKLFNDLEGPKSPLVVATAADLHKLGV